MLGMEEMIAVIEPLPSLTPGNMCKKEVSSLYVDIGIHKTNTCNINVLHGTALPAIEIIVR